MRELTTALLAVAALVAATSARADDHLKIVMGGRSQGETFVAEVGRSAGIFKKQGLDIDILYTDGGGETQQVVIAGSADIGGAVGFPGVLGVYGKGAPIRVIGASFTGGSQIYWYVPANSPIKVVADLAGKTVSYSVTGSSTHSGLLAMQKYTGVEIHSDRDRQRNRHVYPGHERADRCRLGRRTVRRRGDRAG